MILNRCEWVGDHPLYIKYHDEEWGVPVYDDRKLFEFLILEGAQAGLSWITILKKRENYRRALDDFDVQKVAEYGNDKVEELLNNKDLIRNRRKIESVITNAKCFIEVQRQFGSFSKYIWQFVNSKPINNVWESKNHVPVSTRESDNMSEDLKKRGFKFVGTVICYSFMQAVGMVNDHVIDCFRHEQIKNNQALSD